MLPASAPTARASKEALGQAPRSRLLRLWRLLRGGDSSPAKLSAACALGLFVGCLPLYGLHFPICLGLCLLLRLDLVVTYLAANVSNPFVAPFLITAEVEVGSLLLHGRHAAFDLERARAVGVSGFLAQAAAGSVVVGALLAAVGGALTFAVASRRRPRDSALESAIERTLARYRGAPIGDRFYVAGKLRHDPVLRRIYELDVPLGDVLDAGAGRGQLGLCLLEASRAGSLAGFDADARKVALARAAAGSDARFEVADLSSAELPEVDTVLLVDVLHYLPENEQDALLERLSACVRAGGRVLVRDVDGSRGPKGELTRLLERVATATGWHRSRSRLCFRPIGATTSVLEARGFTCSVQGASEGTPFANVLVVAQR